MPQLSAEKVLELSEKTVSLNVKFVRLTTDEYRFCDLYSDHSSLVKSGETAKSAGCINLCDGNVRVPDHRSSTLNLGPAADDEGRIKTLFSIGE